MLLVPLKNHQNSIVTTLASLLGALANGLKPGLDTEAEQKI